MTDGRRDYKRELANEKANGTKRAKDRLARGRARTKAGLKDGDPREVDHVKPLSQGGSNDRSNLRVVSRKANANKEVARKKRSSK